MGTRGIIKGSVKELPSTIESLALNALRICIEGNEHENVTFLSGKW